MALWGRMGTGFGRVPGWTGGLGVAMSLRRFRPITRDMVAHFRGVPDDVLAHSWGMAHGEPMPGWMEAALVTWGMAGVSMRCTDGYAFILVTPGEALPADHPMRRVPRTSGAAVVVVACAPAAGCGGDSHAQRVAEVPPQTDASPTGHRAGASCRDRFHSVPVGRQLTGFLAGRLHGSVPAIEAGGVECGRPGDCRDLRIAPEPWLESVGFRLVDPLDAAPVRRMQLDLRHTVAAEDLGHRFLDWMRGWSHEPASEPSTVQRKVESGLPGSRGQYSEVRGGQRS